jgi:hypothetical protein
MTQNYIPKNTYNQHFKKAEESIAGLKALFFVSINEAMQLNLYKSKLMLLNEFELWFFRKKS